MHNGQFDTLNAIIGFCSGAAAQARPGTLRNGAGTLQGIAFTQNDIALLVTFLISE